MPHMFKYAADRIIFFDLEYVPCLETGRRVYGLAEDMPDAAVLTEMYRLNGATPEEPRPMLKLFLYRVVSISTIIRQKDKPLRLHTLSGIDLPEQEMLERFLQAGVGVQKPQLVGFASVAFDLTVAFQRALINGCLIPHFCARPDKPWEGADYFSDFSDWNIDLLTVLGGKDGKSKPKLDEIALACRIPGKLGMSGADVADAWFAGSRQAVIEYNECDVATTYLLWLALARMSGWVSSDEYVQETWAFRALLETKATAGATHLQRFLREWDRLLNATQTAKAA